MKLKQFLNVDEIVDRTGSNCIWISRNAGALWQQTANQPSFALVHLVYFLLTFLILSLLCQHLYPKSLKIIFKVSHSSDQSSSLFAFLLFIWKNHAFEKLSQHASARNCTSFNGQFGEIVQLWSNIRPVIYLKKKQPKKLNKHAFDQSLFYKNIIVCKSFNYSPILI